MNIAEEKLWEVFQTVYEPGSRGSLDVALRNQPDVVDGILAVAEWAWDQRDALAAAGIGVNSVTNPYRVDTND